MQILYDPISLRLYLDGTLDAAQVSTRRAAIATATGTVTIAATSAATATSILALPATAYNGGLIKIEFMAAQTNFTPATAADYESFTIWDNDAPADLGIVATVSGVVAAKAQVVPLYGFLELTPAAGVHTYSVRGFKSAADATALVVAGAGGANTKVPMQITATYV